MSKKSTLLILTFAYRLIMAIPVIFNYNYKKYNNIEHTYRSIIKNRFTGFQLITFILYYLILLINILIIIYVVVMVIKKNESKKEREIRLLKEITS